VENIIEDADTRGKLLMGENQIHKQIAQQTFSPPE